MKILISSAFVQITFGLKTDTLDVFNTIFIAPRKYRYKHSADVYVGDVNPFTRTISLSWPAVKSGFRIPDDGLNLCIHEFGHSLILENSRTDTFSTIFNNGQLKEWTSLAEHFLENFKNGKQGIFRDYASMNLMEFFAVSLELFFEKPYEFDKQEPRLFLALCKLLNQDIKNPVNPVL